MEISSGQARSDERRPGTKRIDVRVPCSGHGKFDRGQEKIIVVRGVLQGTIVDRNEIGLREFRCPSQGNCLTEDRNPGRRSSERPCPGLVSAALFRAKTKHSVDTQLLREECVTKSVEHSYPEPPKFDSFHQTTVRVVLECIDEEDLGATGDPRHFSRN